MAIISSDFCRHAPNFSFCSSHFTIDSCTKLCISKDSAYTCSRTREKLVSGSTTSLNCIGLLPSYSNRSGIPWLSNMAIRESRSAANGTVSRIRLNEICHVVITAYGMLGSRRRSLTLSLLNRSAWFYSFSRNRSK